MGIKSLYLAELSGFQNCVKPQESACLACDHNEPTGRKGYPGTLPLRRLQCGSLAELHSRCAHLRFPPCGGANFFSRLGGHLKIKLFWALRHLNPSCELAITTFLDLVCWFPVFLI